MDQYEHRAIVDPYRIVLYTDGSAPRKQHLIKQNTALYAWSIMIIWQAEESGDWYFAGALHHSLEGTFAVVDECPC